MNSRILSFRIRLFCSSCNCSHNSVFCLKLALFLATYSLDVAIRQMCFDSLATKRSEFHIPDTFFLSDVCMYQLSVLHAYLVVFSFFCSNFFRLLFQIPAQLSFAILPFGSVLLQGC